MGRQALLVLGMHRSGTSVMAGLLAHLGARAPEALMPPDANNPEGYWESQVFHDFHERLLRMGGTRWDSWTRIPSEWLSNVAAAQLRDECINLLRTEFPDSALFVLKDPRMCRLLPFWIPTLTAAGITPSAVLVVRNPQDVARSLERRNGLQRTTGLLLWLRHVLEAEFQSRLIRRWVVRSEELLADWQQVADGIERKLGITWPTRSSDKDHEISRFVRSACRQVEPNADDGGFPEPLKSWLNRTWEAMAVLHGPDQEGAAAATRTLDEVRTQFDEITALVDAAAQGLEAQRLADVDRLDQRLATVGSELKSAQLELETTRADLQATRSNLQAVEADLQHHLAASVAQREALGAERDLLRAQTADLETERARLTALVAALYDSKSWRITAPLRAVWGMLLPRHRS